MKRWTIVTALLIYFSPLIVITINDLISLIDDIIPIRFFNDIFSYYYKNFSEYYLSILFIAAVLLVYMDYLKKEQQE